MLIPNDISYDSVQELAYLSTERPQKSRKLSKPIVKAKPTIHEFKGHSKSIKFAETVRQNEDGHRADVDTERFVILILKFRL